VTNDFPGEGSRSRGIKYGETRCYIRDPDGYIIEVGQSKPEFKYGRAGDPLPPVLCKVFRKLGLGVDFASLGDDRPGVWGLAVGASRRQVLSRRVISAISRCVR
jgi:hypothetical protein